MIRRNVILLVAILGIAAMAGSSRAQHWTKVAHFGSVGASAWFFNANEGFVGTGQYLFGGLAAIYYTTDGGATWGQSVMPNPTLQGDVTDIFFMDRMNGLATIADAYGYGWSGLYKTSDGGRSWDLFDTLNFPTAVRVTKNGWFVNDRYEGIKYSSDGGKTWRIVAQSSGALGLDFLDDNNGYATGEAAAFSPHYVTFDGGQNWTANDQPHEAWTVYADRVSGKYIYASERDPGTGTGSAIEVSNDKGNNYLASWSGTTTQISGGIAGWRGCVDVVYVQGGDSVGINGILRSENGGSTWAQVGGPQNTHDTRFAVTGRGAVVYALDGAGDVWKTMDGGDGTLSPSILKLTTEQPLTNSLIGAQVCDSAKAVFLCSLNACDSAKILGVSFVNDTLGECSASQNFQSMRAISHSISDSVVVVYHPQTVGTKSISFRLRLQQPDGYFEDTILTQKFQGLPSRARFQYSALISQAPRAIDFGNENICSGDSILALTIQNIGCAPATITSLTTSGAPYTIISSFRQTDLDPTNARTFLISYKPSTLGPNNGALYVATVVNTDTILLTGIGSSGVTALNFIQPEIQTSLCDSLVLSVALKNLSCSAISVDSLVSSSPITITSFSASTLQPDSTTTLTIHFVPVTSGAAQVPVKVYARVAGSTYDTTLLLSTIGQPAGPVAVLSTNTINFGNVTQCDVVTQNLVVVAGGCGALAVDSVTVNSGLYSGASNQLKNLASGQTDTIAVTLTHPPIGNDNATIVVHTNAGDQTVQVLATGVADNGAVGLSLLDSTTLTCESSLVKVILHNSTCGTISIDSVTIGGPDAGDYHLVGSAQQQVPTTDVDTLEALFTPQGSGARTASVTVHITRQDGSHLDTIINIQPTGIATPPICLVAPDSVIQEAVNAIVMIPIYSLDSTGVPIDQLSLTLSLNTNLLNPKAFILQNSELQGGNVGTFNVSTTAVNVVVTIPGGVQIKKGIIGWLQCSVTITDTMNTTVSVSSASISNTLYPAACLSAGGCAPADSSTQFALDPLCGDRTITDALANELPITIGSITPNPTHDKIFLTFAVASGYTNDGTLQIIDELGNILDSRTLIFGKSDQTPTMEIPLSGSSGIRYVRLTSKGGTMTRAVLLER